MASFQAKIGQKRPRYRENKIIVPIHSYPTRNRKFQKNSKKIQKIKKQHYGFISRQSRSEKAGKERKKNLSFRSVPTRSVIENSKKIAKKIQKTKKQRDGFISCQSRSEKARKERKQKLSFPSIPTQHVIENSKKIAKKFKKLKNSVMASFQSKISRKRPRRRENRNYRSLPFLPNT